MRTSVHIIDPVDVNVFLERMNLVEWLAANGTIVRKHFRGVDFQMASQCRIA